VRAFVARLTAKDPAHRVSSAAEAAVWAGLLRDGAGAGAVLRGWPDAPPVQTRAADWFRRRAVLAYACVAGIALIVVVLASVIGFASTPRPGHAPAISPPGAPARNGGVAAPRPVSPAASPGRQPAMSPVAEQEPASPVAEQKRVSGGQGAPPAKPGHDTGSARGPGRGHGHAKGNGTGPGNGTGQGDGNGQGG
jgi:hypothetical protein